MKNFFRSFLFLFSVVVLSGCSHTPDNYSSDASQSSPEKNIEKPVEIVASFYPLAYFTKQIAQDHAHVVNLSGMNEPHEYMLSPKDRIMLAHANLIVYQGSGMEAWAEDLIPELQKKNIATLEASHGLSLLKNEEEDEHEDEDDHHEEDEHNHGAFNPHTWLDPVLAQQIVQNIAESLLAVDPKNADIYQKNAANLTKKLETLDQEYKTTLSNCMPNEAIVSHNAFGYLENRYGFTLDPIAGIAPSDEPSAKLLADLKKIANNKTLTHILTEENSTKKYSEALAKETGLKMIAVNTMEAVPSNKDYFEIAKNNLSTLSLALGCQ